MTDSQNGNDKNADAVIENAAAIIEKFGGIRPMAAKMVVPVTTVQGWKKRGVIPGNRRADIVRAAAINDISLGTLIGSVKTEPQTANQNTVGKPAASAPTPPPFAAVLNETVKTQNTAAEARHDNAVKSGLATDDILKSIKKAETRAVQKSSIVSILLVSIMTGVVGFLMWPTQRDTAENAAEILDIKAALADQAAEKPGLFDELSRKIAELQAQIAGVTQKVESVASAVASPELGPMGLRLDRLEQQVQTLTQVSSLPAVLEKFKGLTGSPEGQTQLQKSISELMALVAGTKQSGQSVDDALTQAQVEGAEDSALTQTLQGVAPADVKAAALLLALAQFRASTHRGAPFAGDLALLQSLVGRDDPELAAALDRLAPQAERGVLSPNGLSREFKGLAGEIVVASLAGEDVSIKEKAEARLNDVLQIKKEGVPINGTETQKTVTQAQALLDAGDIEGAMALLQTLEGSAAQTAEPFMDQAQMTLTAQKAQELLTGKVLSGLKGMSGGGGAPYTAGGSDISTLLRQFESIGGGAPKTYP